MTTPTIVPGLDRATAMRLAEGEIDRYAEILDKLDDQQWLMETVCEPWTVRDMAGHVLGNYEGLLSLRARFRQTWKARRRGGNFVDAISANQIGERVECTTADLIARLRSAGAASVVARRRVPRMLRAMRVTVPMHAGNERWSVAYLDDIIYTRDTWMHRMDTCAAVDLEPDLSAAHDGVIVADIVREWELRHAQPVQLTLTGPAGGSFGSGSGGSLTLDAVEFCRLLSGRGRGEGLLAVEVGY